MRLSIVVISWNTLEILNECLGLIEAYSIGMSHEIIVVDNHSTDGSPEMVRSTFPDIKLISNPDNLGFPKAANLGIAASSGEYVALLNSDTMMAPGALAELVEYLDKQRRVAAVGPQLMGKTGHLQYSGGCAPTPTAALKHLFPVKSLLGGTSMGMFVRSQSKKEPIPLDWLCAACLVLRREALDSVGMLDEAYFMYAEDLEFGLRLRKSGWQVHLVPWVRVIHYGGASSSSVPETKLLWLDGVFRIAADRLSSGSYLIFGLLLSAAFFTRFILSKLLKIFPGGIVGAETATARDFREYARTSLNLSLRGRRYAAKSYFEREKRLKVKNS